MHLTFSLPCRSMGTISFASPTAEALRSTCKPPMKAAMLRTTPSGERLAMRCMAGSREPSTSARVTAAARGLHAERVASGRGSRAPRICTIPFGCLHS